MPSEALFGSQFPPQGRLADQIWQAAGQDQGSKIVP